MDKLHSAIENLKAVMAEEGIDTTKGMPEELFHFATTLIPYSNVDLFITDDQGRLLLSWRDDKLFGKGWHIPGGCLRLHETMEYRVQQTALKEIGAEVVFDKNRYLVSEGIGENNRLSFPDRNIRSHSISVLFYCKLPEGIEIDNKDKKETDPGFLKWFDEKPNDLLDEHKKLYGNLIDSYFMNRFFDGKDAVVED